MYGSRVGIVTDGFRQYDQQWGPDHAPNIDFDSFESLPESESCVICLGYPLTSYQLIRMGKKTKEKFYKVDFEYVQRIAEILKKNGTKNLAVISSLGASKYSPNFYLRTKGLMEDSLKKLKFNKLIIARPAHLLGDREVPRKEIGITIIELFDKIFKNLLIGPFKKYKNIHGSVVANKIYDSFDESYQPGIYIIENDKIKSNLLKEIKHYLGRFSTFVR